jgi:hypothetical protein
LRRSPTRRRRAEIPPSVEAGIEFLKKYKALWTKLAEWKSDERLQNWHFQKDFDTLHDEEQLKSGGVEMSASKAEIERFAQDHTEEDLMLAMGIFAKKVFANKGDRKPIPVQDEEHKPVGYFVPTGMVKNPDLSDYYTLLAVAEYRSANPPDRYLTPEEFIGWMEEGAE